MPLKRTEVHLWFVFPDDLSNTALLRTYHHLMSPEESAQYKRFHFAKGRHEYMVTRALVRTVLSRYARVEPWIWRFEKNAYGKPAIASPSGIPCLSFNLSTTDGLIVCLVALDREVGVDVEDIQRLGKTGDIANQFFSRTEVDALHALPVEAQHDRFFEYWTLKEAYIKARGRGLSLPLERFSFHLDPGQPVRISFDPCLVDDPQSWQFVQFRLTSRHIMAAALRRGQGPDLAIYLRQTVPLLY